MQQSFVEMEFLLFTRLLCQNDYTIWFWKLLNFGLIMIMSF